VWKQSFIKYRGMFASTTLFVGFFIAFLAVNFLLQTSTINDIEYFNVVQKIQKQFQDEGVSNGIIEDITTLNNGGSISLSESQKIIVPMAKKYSPEASLIVDRMVAAVASGEKKLVSDQLSEFNLLVTAKKERAVKLLKTLQIIAAILTVLLYFIVIVQLVLQLSNTDDVEVQSRQETDNIMGALSEGIFLLDKDYEIGAEQSASLKGMFKKEKDLEGNFFDFISSYVTQKDVELAQQYLELLYGDRVKERLVVELNPLTEIEVNIVRRDGSYENHYLDFKFKRVIIAEKVSHLLCSVSDVTRQVVLEQQLTETKEAQEAQLDMLKSILHIDRDKLSLFFNNTTDILREVNKILEDEGKSFGDDKIRTVLNNIGSNIHQVKGDAAVLGLHRFEFSAHDLEDIVSAIKKDNKKITGKDLLPLTTGLRKMFVDLEDLKELVGKFSGINLKKINASESGGERIGEEGPIEVIDIASSLMQISDTVAERSNKTVKLNVRGLNSQLVPKRLVSVVQSIATQCIRNSIVHGIEPTAERLALGKSEVAKLSASFLGFDKGYMLFIRDDGRGVDEEKVLQEAVSKGIIFDGQDEKTPKEQIKNLLFSTDFSTASEVSMDAGRGFGLDVVKRLANEHGAKINLTYEKNKFCQLSILFPFR
jgi:HPt (histidine-containing phosphotransfer) domain-containing protein